jgi:diguanylate cyclase (GGDEF)-like protein
MFQRTPGRAAPRRYRIGVVLAVLAFVPLLGTGWFTVGEVLSARAELERAETVDASVRDLVKLSELRTRLLDEQNWTAAQGGMSELGLSPRLVFGLTGIDVPSEVDDATARVDVLLAELGLADIEADVARLRSDTDRSLTEISDSYNGLERRVGRRADELLDELVVSAGLLSDRGSLVTSIRVLEAATVARQAISAEFNHFFGAQFSEVADRTDELQALVVESALRRDAIERIERLAPAESATGVALQVILTSEPTQAFDRTSLALVDGSFGSDSEVALTAVLADLDSVAEAFRDSSAATDVYFDLVEAAGEDVYAATAEAGAGAERRNQLALGALVGLAGVSVAMAVAATRAIVQPLHRLAAAAGRIRDGQTTADMVAETGPVEVREAAQALNEAGAHLALAERQALALAEGDLGHHSLSETSSGALGASLQNAVRTLAASLQEREDFRRRMTHEATHDGLTQLPNRNASLGQLRQAVARTGRADRRLAVLFIDLDGFKEVNDHHGHPAGDSVLRVVARRLADAARPGDHVGRLGGDEFVIIAEPIADEGDALALAEAIQAALGQPIQLDASTVAVGVSIGIAVSKTAIDDAGDLLRDADLALYRAKELGRNRLELCDDDLRSALAERADLEHAIRHALMADEFVLYYQPIVEPKTSTVVGYEALIRWDRPGHGLVAPDSFIPFAERSDLIVHIDRWVVETVARQIVAWEADGTMGDIPVSINISGRHLASSQFLADITGPIEAYGIHPSRIIVEITESALLDDLTSAAIRLQNLRQRGIRIAIDDFGTGYTSLAHLKSLPIDILKIDRSFTNDESATSLVQLIIDTGHLLGATVTAEGIETAEQALALGAMGSDDLQGYLYGRPVPARELDGGSRRTPTGSPG